MQVVIRHITRQDLQAVYNMLVESAAHEGLSHQFTMTQEDLETKLLGPCADWYGLVADAADTQATRHVGCCLYSIANLNRAFNPTLLLHIDDLYVKPAWRQRGIGKALLQEVARLAAQNGSARIELWCMKNNTLGQQFYQKYGGQKLDIDVFRFIPSSLLSL